MTEIRTLLTCEDTMGEIADMMIDGELCERCGMFIDDEAEGFPRLCADCAAEDDDDGVP